jgi:hypothetical protein
VTDQDQVWVTTQWVAAMLQLAADTVRRDTSPAGVWFIATLEKKPGEPARNVAGSGDPGKRALAYLVLKHWAGQYLPLRPGGGALRIEVNNPGDIHG